MAFSPSRRPIDRVLCNRPKEVTFNLCPSSAVAGVAVLVKSGGHHLGENYGELADEILAAIPN
jgi:type IV secretory pathway VirJ component